MNEEVTLRVNGEDYKGWLKISITAGIERQARDFELEITRTWPGDGINISPRKVRPGDLCEIWIGRDKVLTGYVDGTPIRYDDLKLTVGVKGRSKTADLVDCSAEFRSGQWRNRRIESIAADLAAPYKISVLKQAETGAAFPDHQIQPGESIFECIGRMLVLRQMLSTDDADGNMVLVSPGSAGVAGTALELGKNVLAGECALDYKDVFSKYVCKGQRAGTDLDSAENLAESVSSFEYQVSNLTSRYRLLQLTQTGQVDVQTCADRVRYEARYRPAKAVESTYKVQGWRQSDGRLWIPNQLVQVIDPLIGFNDQLLIVQVEYRLDETGSTCLLRVGPLAGYVPSPEAKKKKKKSDDGGDWLKGAELVQFPVKGK